MPNFNRVREGKKCSNIQSTPSSAKTVSLSLLSTTNEIKRYFIAVLELSKSKEEFPVNLDDVWMLVYGRKQEAVRALTSEIFIQDIDSQLLRQNAQTPKGGRPALAYHLSVSCLAYFIDRNVRPVFDVSREVLHMTVDVLPHVSY